jgi:hypothetical protein
MQRPRSTPDKQRSGAIDHRKVPEMDRYEPPTPEQEEAWTAYAAARHNRECAQRRRQTGDE